MPPDVIVVGSGAAGVHAAQTCLEQGCSVLMIDGGNPPPSSLPSATSSFFDIRRSDTEQWKFFLGLDYSGIPLQGLEGGLGGGMTSGTRSYVVRDASTHLPLSVDHGTIIHSLAQGGLAAAWGAACAYFSRHDVEAMNLPADQMYQSYRTITDRIGISGPTSLFPSIQPAVPLNDASQLLLDRSHRCSSQLSSLGVSLFQPHSAILTRPLFDRLPNPLHDMDYYSDPERSVYRPQYTLDALRMNPRFSYEPSWVVESITDTLHNSTVHAVSLDALRTCRSFSAPTVILAAGAINTARILLRTLGYINRPIPFVTKPHTYIACAHFPSLFRTPKEHQMSLCQLLLADHRSTHLGFDGGVAQLYPYRSLLLFRLLNSLPLPLPQALRILQLCTPSLFVADVRFPAYPSQGHTLSLSSDGSVHIQCVDIPDDAQAVTLGRLKKAMKILGLLPVRTQAMPHGSTSHHAGTVPITSDPALLSCSQDGKVHSLHNVFVADASMFSSLPAYPHTLTIMANADRVARSIAKRF